MSASPPRLPAPPECAKPSDPGRARGSRRRLATIQRALVNLNGRSAARDGYCLNLMAAAAAAGKNLGFETEKHKPNLKANEIIASNVIAELVQRVVLNGEDAKATVGDAANKLDALMKA